MSHHTPARWLITYDIRDPKRLGKVFKALKKEGIPVQYSVFYLHLSAAKIGSLMVALAKLTDSRNDDVRAYRLPERGIEISLGTSILPKDAWHDNEALAGSSPTKPAPCVQTGSATSCAFVIPADNSLSEQRK